MWNTSPRGVKLRSSHFQMHTRRGPDTPTKKRFHTGAHALAHTAPFQMPACSKIKHFDSQYHKPSVKLNHKSVFNSIIKEKSPGHIEDRRETSFEDPYEEITKRAKQKLPLYGPRFLYFLF